MGMFDMFSKPAAASANQQQNGQQQPQNQQPGKVQNNVAPNGQSQQAANDQQNGKMPGSSNEPANPMDQYAKMWDNATTSEDSAPPSFNLDPKVLNDVSGKLNFMDGANPELVQRATSGDTTALMELMNSVAQNAYRMSLQHGSQLTDKFVSARTQFEGNSLGSKVKGELTNQALASLPNFKHPAVAQQLRDTAKRLQAQNPDASPQEIATMAKQYVTDLASALNPQQQNGQGNNQNGQAPQAETDWDSYLGLDSNG